MFKRTVSKFFDSFWFQRDIFEKFVSTIADRRECPLFREFVIVTILPFEGEQQLVKYSKPDNNSIGQRSRLAAIDLFLIRKAEMRTWTALVNNWFNLAVLNSTNIECDGWWRVAIDGVCRINTEKGTLLKFRAASQTQSKFSLTPVTIVTYNPTARCNSCHVG